MRYIKQSFTLVLVALLACFGSQVNAQLIVDGNVTAEDLINTLVGTGLDVSNIQLTCADGAYGTMDATFTNLGMNEGVVLTSGNITNMIGPNNGGGTSFSNGTPGDPDLDGLNPGYFTQDACILQFDFIPLGDTLSFNYVFGSEEYFGYECSTFNDVFGFFITGGPEYPVATNIALVPGTNDAVSINNVNNGIGLVAGPGCIPTNDEFFVDNGNGQNPDPNSTLQYDGLTVVMQAIAAVTPCETYTLKLAVADAGDTILDSGVFLQANSINVNYVEIAASAVATTVVGVDNPIEGCVDAVLTFERTGTVNGDLVVDFELGGTATNGEDYDFIPDFITIPEGEDTYELFINTIDDGQGEGTETLTISLVTELSCDSTDVQFVELLIDEQQPLTVSDDQFIDPGESVQLLAEGGSGNYGWYPFLSLNDASIPDPIATPDTTTTYTVTSFLGDCVYQEGVTVFVAVCEVEAGEVTPPDVTTVCEGGSFGPATVTGNSEEEEFEYIYIVTGSDSNTIVQYSEDGSFDAAGLEVGDYCIYGMSYVAEGDEALDLEVANIDEIQAQLDDGACFALTSCYTVTIEFCCTTEAGTASADGEVLCFGSSVTGSSNGDAVLDDNDIIGYALHNSAAGNISEDGFELYSLNASGVFTNDSTFIAPFNTDLYISTVVGNELDGLPDLADGCLVVSPGVPVAFLAPIHFEENSACDYNVTGDYTLTLDINGGWPDYDNLESYSVSGNFGGNIGHDETFTIIVPETDGELLIFNVVDNLGCEGVFTDLIICKITPIELLSFTGETLPNGNQINWVTSTEHDNSHFILERSIDGVNFEEITRVDSQGDSEFAQSYDYLDKDAPSGFAYYRLAAVSFSGNVEHSEVISLKRGDALLSLNDISPIPAFDNLQLQFSAPQAERVEIIIYDVAGRIASQFNREAVLGINEISIDIANLNTGVYILTVQDNQSISSARFVKE